MADKRVNNGGKRAGAGRLPTPETNKKPKTLKLARDVWTILDDLKTLSGKSQAVIVENLVRKAKNNPKLIE